MLDVAIIGGGPAGSTAAALLARRGRTVAVFEREKFPRFHIGESLLPVSMEAFDRIGVSGKLAAAGFMVKHGAEITSACGRSETRFYFKDGFRSRRPTALQVERATFDHLLLDHARDCGAAVHEEVGVEKIDFAAGGNPVLTLRNRQGVHSQVEAKYVLDCSGRHTLLGTQHGLKQEYPDLHKFALYAHFENVALPEGVDGTLTRMVRAHDYWFWMIPLSATKSSIGVVMDTQFFRRQRGTPEEIFERCIAEQPVVCARLAGARRVSRVHAAGDYSYRNRTLHGDRWLLAGDAAGFIDPIFSSGVFLAILCAEHAADAIHRAIDNPALAEKLFARYERTIGKVMNLYLKFVRMWYQQEFVETLLAPKEFFQVVPAVNAVLAGNIAQSFALRWRLWLFRGIVALQKIVPICPRLTFHAEAS